MTIDEKRIDKLKTEIESAFAGTKYPGDWCLRGSNEGNEPYLVEKEFKGRDDWHSLDPKFIDQAPEGYTSALCFFSDEAFHFYLPAYLIADIDDQLECIDLIYHLCHSLTDEAKTTRVNPLRYGERTWFESGRYKFAIFNKAEACAIVAYLKFKQEMLDPDESDKAIIEQALQNFWLEKAGEKELP